MSNTIPGVSYRKKLCLDIASLERIITDNYFSYKDIDVWPVVRAEVCMASEDEVLRHGRLAANLRPKFSSFNSSLKDEFGSFHNQCDNINELFISNHRDSDFDIIFHTRPERHAVNYYGESVCGQIDYLHLILRNKFKCIKLEEFSKNVPDLFPRKIDPLYYTTQWNHILDIFYKEMSDKFSWGEFGDFYNKYEGVCRAMNVAGGKAKALHMSRRFALIEAYANHFYELLRDKSPKAIFTELFYNPETWGLILAAKRLGIPTIEVQHGLVGKYQWFSTHWTSIPEVGYDLLPDYIWCFDKETVENISSTNAGTKSLTPVCGNIPKLTYWANYPEKPICTDHRTYLDELHTAPFVVLVALNYHIHAPQSLIRAIKRLPSSWRWLIRLHPMSLPGEDIIEQTYREEGLANVEFHYASRVPLYEALQSVDHLVTSYSTMATEALPFGIGVTLNDDIGAELYPQFVADGRMSFANTDDVLEEILLRAQKSRTASRDKSRAMPSIRDTSAQIFSDILADWEGQSQIVSDRKKRLERSSIFDRQSAGYKLARAVTSPQAVSSEAGEHGQVAANKAPLVAAHCTNKMSASTSDRTRAKAHRIADVGNVLYAGMNIWPILQTRIENGRSAPAASDVGLSIQLKNDLEKFRKSVLDETYKPPLPAISMVKGRIYNATPYDISSPIEPNRIKVEFNFDRRDFGVLIDGKYESIRGSNLYDILSTSYKVDGFELSRPDTFKTVPRRRDALFISTPWNGDEKKFREVFSALYKWDEEEKRKTYLEIKRMQKHHQYNSINVIDDVHSDISLVSAYTGIFINHFRQSKPNIVFLESSNVIQNFSAIIAAKYLDIPSVAIHEGSISGLRGRMADWRGAPEHCYDFLPDYYWCGENIDGLGIWDSTNIVVRPEWYSGQEECFGVGRQTVQPALASRELRSFFSGIDQRQHVVLVTLADGMHTPGFLLQAMRHLPSTWHWLVKLAPQSRLGADAVELFYRRAGITNCEVSMSSRAPVSELFARANHVLAIAGTCEQEASMLGIPTTVVDETLQADGDGLCKKLLQAATQRKAKRGAFAADETLGAVIDDWASLAEMREKRQARYAKSAFFQSAPSPQDLWRHARQARSVRRSKFKIVPPVEIQPATTEERALQDNVLRQVASHARASAKKHSVDFQPQSKRQDGAT